MNYLKHPSAKSLYSFAVYLLIAAKIVILIALMFFLAHLTAISFFKISHILISFIEISDYLMKSGCLA